MTFFWSFVESLMKFNKVVCRSNSLLSLQRFLSYFLMFPVCSPAHTAMEPVGKLTTNLLFEMRAFRGRKPPVFGTDTA